MFQDYMRNRLGLSTRQGDPNGTFQQPQTPFVPQNTGVAPPAPKQGPWDFQERPHAFQEPQQQHPMYQQPQQNPMQGYQPPKMQTQRQFNPYGW
jgi:hypothetical protein